jgi:hypothetical protein
MDTAHTFPSPPPEPIDPAADSAESGGSFWTGAPKLLAAFATLLGSIVALTTVLVQAGVIGSRTAGETTPTVPVRSTPVRTVSIKTTVQPARVVLPVAATPSLEQALGNLNGLLSQSARTKGDLGRLIGEVQAGPSAIDRDTAVREIDEIVSQRAQLHAELADFRAPAALSKAVALLRDSITASLADDRLVRQWIVARYDGNVAADSLWLAQVEASRAASEAKRVFRAEYANRLLASGLSDSIPDY